MFASTKTASCIDFTDNVASTQESLGERTPRRSGPSPGCSQELVETMIIPDQRIRSLQDENATACDVDEKCENDGNS